MAIIIVCSWRINLAAQGYISVCVCVVIVVELHKHELYITHILIAQQAMSHKIFMANKKENTLD